MKYFWLPFFFIVVNTSVIAKPVQIATDLALTRKYQQTLNCLFQHIKTDYELKSIPALLNSSQLSQLNIDALFTSLDNPQLALFLKSSDPIAINKLSWYSNKVIKVKTEDFKNAAKIGVIVDSSEYHQLAHQGYNITNEVNSTDELIQLFKANKIDALVGEENTIDIVLREDRPHKTFLKYNALGLFYSPEFFGKNQDLIQQLNQQIPNCNARITQLSEEDRKVLSHVSASIKSWMQNPIIIDAINAQNKKHHNISKGDIMIRDNKWRRERLETNRPLITQLLTNDCSHFLKEQKSASNGLYSEIFVMDNKGLNVGLSDETSDYWQGDEAKFIRTFHKGKGAIYLDHIRFDESSRSFLSQVSLSITDPNTDTLIGAITVGVNMEKALISSSND